LIHHPTMLKARAASELIKRDEIPYNWQKECCKIGNIAVQTLKANVFDIIKYLTKGEK